MSVKCSLFFNPVFLNVLFCPNLPLELFWEAEPRFLLGLCAWLLADCPQRVSFKAGLWTVNPHTFLKIITTRDLVGVDLLWFFLFPIFPKFSKENLSHLRNSKSMKVTVWCLTLV